MLGREGLVEGAGQVGGDACLDDVEYFLSASEQSVQARAIPLLPKSMHLASA